MFQLRNTDECLKLGFAAILSLLTFSFFAAGFIFFTIAFLTAINFCGLLGI